jgi:hypothetical protein
MIICPHLIVGAAIGAKIKNIGWIIVLAIISHVVLDKIPHWDYGDKETKRFKESKSLEALFTFFVKLLIDGLIGLILIILVIWYRKTMDLEHLIPVLIGMFFAILPDILLGIFTISYVKSKKPSKNFIDFYHKTIHHSNHIRKPTLIGLGAQILIGLIAILIILL